MELELFYSWQSDLSNTKSFISKCLNLAAKEIYGEHSIIISSDARNSSGSVNLTDTLFKKINQSTIFVADLTIINSNLDGRKCCNPNVLIELGYALNNLGNKNILILFDTKYGKVEDLPFDIRQNRIIKFNSEGKTKTLTNKLIDEVANILSTVNPTIYDFLFSEINNQIITHLIEFSKIFYFNSDCKERYDYTYFINKTEREIESDIINNEFLGFDLFNNLTILENEFKEFLNQKTTNTHLSENHCNILSHVVLSMKSISKFLNYEPFFVQSSTLSPEYNIVSAKSLNPYNEDKLLLLRQSGNPLNAQGIVISANYINANKLQYIKNTYKCVNAKYFVQVIKNYINSIIEWSKHTNDALLNQLDNIKQQQNNQ